MSRSTDSAPFDSNVGRRQFLYAAGGFAGLVLTTRYQALAYGGTQSFSANPFTLGVASGDPLPDGVVLWTRLAPDPLAVDGNGGMDPVRVPVHWIVSADDRMRQIVRRGVTFANPSLAHSVHVEVDGLRPGRPYWYQFQVRGEWSSVGRTATSLPFWESPRQLRFGVASCQHYEQGFYTAYGHMANEDLDLVVFLGDYIYEGGVSPTLPRQHDGIEPMTLAAYRNRHALYKTDPNLQAAHGTFPWVAVFDDHEVENNWAGLFDQNGSTPEVFLPRRATAFQAYYEHMPLRAGSIPRGPDIQMYRRLRFGDLAQFNMLDTRQYRDNQACDDGTDIGCAEAIDPARTITGAAQEQWLLGGLDQSRARWNIVGQQVFMAQRDFEPGALQRLSMDGWDGYAASRDRVLGGAAAREVSNLVVLTGDVHANYAADLKVSFDDPASPVIGSEFVGTSISSGGDGVDVPANSSVLLAENPHIKFVNSQRGYLVCELTRQQWRTQYRTVPFVTTPDAPITTRATFVTLNGVPGVNQES
jgi:alkaline phosphatase D